MVEVVVIVVGEWPTTHVIQYQKMKEASTGEKEKTEKCQLLVQNQHDEMARLFFKIWPFSAKKFLSEQNGVSKRSELTPFWER